MEPVQVLPLPPQFRLVHEPFGSHTDDQAAAFVGRQDEVADLAGRISLSRGGAFLITGYRGVGKTSFVNRVLQEVTDRLESLPRDPYDVVVARLNFSRPATGIELMYYIIREVYAALLDKGVFERLDPETRADLQLAVSRTSLNLAMTSLQEREGGAEFSAGLSKLPLLGAVPGLKLTARSRRAQTREFAFLAYDERSAEQDLIRLGRKLSTASYSARQTWFPPQSHQKRLKIILVFDELDKLEPQSPEKLPLDETLSQLKGLFTTSGVTFLFVAGRELYDRWLDDLALGNSIYESVFTDARYLPALWTDANAICDALAGVGLQPDGTSKVYLDFRKYLAYRGRGIPRRIIRGFNGHVAWTPTGAQLSFSVDDARAFGFYAGLHDLVASSEEQLLPEIGTDLVPRRADQRRLSLYYAIDWILDRGEMPFTVNDLVAGTLSLNPQLAPEETAARDLSQRLLPRLLDAGYVERLTSETVAIKVRDDAAAPDGVSAERYRVERGRLVEMGARRTSLGESDARGTEIFAGRYAIDRWVASGGTSTVYEARDQRTGRRVALKVLVDRQMDPEFRERFEREVALLGSLSHPAIASLYDHGIHEGAPYLVLEFIDGLALSDVVAPSGLDEAAVVSIASQILEAVDFIHAKGILWRDAKPSNVVLRPDGSIALLDFGISALLGDRHDGTLLVGTPAYLAPELIAGSQPTVRSDVYAIGVMLYEMVVGEAPFSVPGLSSQNFLDLLELKRGSPSRPSLRKRVSGWLDDVIVRAMQPEAVDRWPSTRDMLDELQGRSAPDTTTAAAAYSAGADLAKRDVDATVYSPHPPTLESSHPVGAAAPMNGGPAKHATPPPPPPTVYTPAPAVSTRPAAEPPQAPGATVFVSAPGIGPALQYLDESPRAERALLLSAEGPWVLGRGRGTNVPIDDPAASRRHAEIVSREGKFWIRDLNTRNGTQLDGEPIRNDERPLHDGSIIGIGAVQLRFTQRGRAPSRADP